MTTIGYFNKTQDGFTGFIRTLAIDAALDIKSAPKASEKAPDFRILAGGNVEIGAAWKKTTAEGKPYLSIRLDDPSFKAPIACRLIDGDDVHRLIWSR